MSEPSILTACDARGVFTITLNRSDARNALNEEAIAALSSACTDAAADEDVRVVVLRGNGPTFCAGADIGWMERLAASDEPANRADAVRFAEMLSALDGLPQPLIGVVHGAAIGGGAGLVAACDAVIASEETFFQFAEVRIGLIPATIAPLVIAKIGVAQARYLFLSARRFGARRAEAMGLVQQVVPAPDALDPVLVSLLDDILAGGPEALRAAKQMTRDLARCACAPADMADLLARVRASDEAREGFRAFREKRPPAWKQGGNE